MITDLARRAAQGRAYSDRRAWTPEEWDAVNLLVQERKLSLLSAADHVRNGIVTVEDYDKAAKAKFVPKTLGAVAADEDAALRDNKFVSQPKTIAKAKVSAKKAARKAAPKAAKEEATGSE